MKIGYLIKVRPDLADIVPEDVDEYVQVFADDNGVYQDEDLEKIKDVDAFIIGMEPVNEQILAATSKLRIVQRLGVGYETLDLDATAKRQIPACNIEGVNKEAVAEHNMMLMLALAKKLPDASRFTEAADWPSARTLTSSAFELKGKTLGIIGFGNTGSSLAKRAAPFEMNIIYNDLLDVNSDVAQALGAKKVERDDVFRNADIVCICTDLNDTSRNMVNEETIAMMGPTTTFICCARGGIVDEPALANALKEGRIAQAGVDVFDIEPIKADNPLIGLPNCILTAHVAGVAHETTMRIWDWAHENVRAVVQRNERPQWIRNGV
ncbi:MAG: NAD(P)-dependent oxidoreductase [Pseudomonadota bacterium]